MGDHAEASKGRPEPGRGRLRVGALVAPAAGVLVWALPLPLEVAQHRLLAIFVTVLVAWMTEVVPIPVTALLIAPAMIAAGITDAKTAFQGYADPLLYLFVGGFFIAHAMTLHGLDRRIAHALVTMPGVRGVPGRARTMLVLGTAVMSMWISNTACAAIALPLVIGLLGPAEGEGPMRKRSSANALLAVAYGSTIGGLGMLVGSPPNAITVRFIRQAEIDFGFVDWAMVNIPIAAVLLAAMLILFRREHRAAERERGARPAGDDVAIETPGPWSRGEKITAAAFGVAVVGWVVPGVMQAASLPGAEAISKALPEGGVALFAASILFVFRDGRPGRARERILPWSEATKIDWGIIILFGGGIALGTQMFDTGLASVLGRGFIRLSGVESVWTLTFVVIVFTIFFSEACSNTATANMLVPLAIAIAVELDVPVLPPALGVGIGATTAFMLPIGTGPSAMVYGTGRVPFQTMVRKGLVLNLVSVAVVWLMLRILCPLFGWA